MANRSDALNTVFKASLRRRLLADDRSGQNRFLWPHSHANAVGNDRRMIDIICLDWITCYPPE